MPGTAYDAKKPTRVVGHSDSGNSFAYRFWLQAPGTNTWDKLGDLTDLAPTLTIGPATKDSRLGYFALIGGQPNGSFVAHLILDQGDSPLACSPGPDTGTCNEDGIGSVRKIITLA